MKTKIVLVHGWAYSSAVWNRMEACFHRHYAGNSVPLEVCRIDLDFCERNGVPVDGKGKKEVLQIDEKTVCIGHSLGALWLLKNMRAAPGAFVAINGFTSFSDCARPEELERMKAGVRKAAQTQVRHFYILAGDRKSVVPHDCNVNALVAGLEMLKKEQAHEELDRLVCPVLALASDNDKIVPAAVSRDHWRQRKLIWHRRAAHVLPVNDPDWCVMQIVRWLEEI